MAPVVTNVAAKDGNGNAIAGGVDFIDVSGTGVGPFIICKATLDPSGVNVQKVDAAGAAYENLAEIAGVAAAVETDTGSAVLQTSLVNITAHLRAILNALTVPISQDFGGRVRVALEQTAAGNTMSVNLGGLASTNLPFDIMQACWANTVRTHFT